MKDIEIRTGGKNYELPRWKAKQIILDAASFLTKEGYYKDGFDYQKMLRSKGIVLKGYSSFAPENLKELKEVSRSLWNEGLCLVFPDKESGKTCRMIVYNDKKCATEIMQIIFHEFAHIKLKHTQQCPNGEAEAMLFSGVATMLISMEQRFHIGRRIRLRNSARNFQHGIFNRREKIC
ncbi:MAG: hypothetical protein IKO57_04525 [Treponema sp.]|nr:hypothetical protein [Treponema sp.]